jgi:hypothetical protein
MADGPQPINLGNAGDIDMYPAETYTAAREIAAAGLKVRDAWRQAEAGLTADEGKIGTGFDDLSAGFRKRYTDLKPQLEKVATEAPVNFDIMGGNGVKGVEYYMELSHQQVELLRRLDG